MATAPEEMDDLAKVAGAVLINIGTLREDVVRAMRVVGEWGFWFIFVDCSVVGVDETVLCADGRTGGRAKQGEGVIEGPSALHGTVISLLTYLSSQAPPRTSRARRSCSIPLASARPNSGSGR